MSRFAVITIELPLDASGTLEDAKTLATLIANTALSQAPHDVTQFRPVGSVVVVALEDRDEGGMGHARARALLDQLDAPDKVDMVG
jgi:hypothetical protein